jgi:hypothetical protein
LAENCIRVVAMVTCLYCKTVGCTTCYTSRKRIYCRAVGCTTCIYPGQKHFCKNCGDTDSNHRTLNCILFRGGLY